MGNCVVFGDCDVYAVSLHRLYNYPLYVIRGYFLEEDWGGKREWDYEDCHIMVKLPNGNYMDSDGEQTAKQLKQRATFANDVKKIKFVPIDEQTALNTFSCSNQESSIKKIMGYIKKRNGLNENMIDGQNMNPATQSLCNTMTVNSYHEVLGRIIAAIGPKNKNPELWAKIAKPLGMLEKANFDINKEKHTAADGSHTNNANGMTGDSIPDEANTWWSAIQSTICEQGPAFD